MERKRFACLILVCLLASFVCGAQPLQFVDCYQGTLASGYTSGGTTLSITSATSTGACTAVLPTGTSYYYLLVKGESTNTDDVFLVSNRSGTTLTVAGAQGHRSASNHSSGAAIIASIMTADAFSQLVVDAAAAAPTSALAKISESVLGSKTASVTFTSIPGTYRNLRLTVQGRCSASSTVDGLLVQVNGDTGNNYTRQFIIGAGAPGTPTTDQSVSISRWIPGNLECATGLANAAAFTVLDIFNYAGTTFSKVAYSTSIDFAGSAASNIRNFSYVNLWNSTAAISSILLKPDGGSNFVTGSVFTLYGY